MYVYVHVHSCTHAGSAWEGYLWNQTHKPNLTLPVLIQE